MNDEQKATIRKATLRLVPFLCFGYFIAYLDRVNIGIAALQMNVDLRLSATAYGAGASIFFVGYLLFEVPSNLIMEKVGARLWITRIMVTWGLTSAAMALVQGEKSLYLIRFLLGVAEAGFFPAAIVYLNNWFPDAYRGRIVGLFFAAVPLSSILGAPLSTALLQYSTGMLGLAGWQWLFIIEGIPAVALGALCLWWLTDSPSKAKWLSRSQAEWLQGVLDRERLAKETTRKYHFSEVFLNLRVLLLCLILFLVLAGVYGAGFWMPQIIKTFTTSNMTVGWITSGLYVLAAVGMIFWTRLSDARGKRVGLVATSCALGGIGFLVCMLSLHYPYVAIIGLGVACIGAFSTLPVFWTLPMSFLTGTAAAVAIALINSSANLSGILVPWFIGLSKDATGDFRLAIGGMGVALLLASVATLRFGHVQKRQSQGAHATVV